MDLRPTDTPGGGRLTLPFKPFGVHRLRVGRDNDERHEKDEAGGQADRGAVCGRSATACAGSEQKIFWVSV